MKLSKAKPGTIVVHMEYGSRYRVIAQGVQLDEDRRLPVRVMEEMGIRSGLGKGGVDPKVSHVGWGYGRKGTLLASDPWTEDELDEGSRYLSLATFGNDFLSLEDFILKWDRTAHLDARRYSSEKHIVVAHPRPSVHDKRLISSTEPFADSVTLLYDGLVTVDTADDAEYPWLGEESGRPVAITTPEGDRYRVGARFLVHDLHGSKLDYIHKRRLESDTEPERSRIKDALLAMAAQTDADPRKVRVTTESVTIPHEVLEALVLGDEYGVAAVLEGQAFLLDAIRDARI